jgi:small basic protein (TIGR04137 family)
MSLDRSLKGASSLVRHRNVLTRTERLERLADEEKWDESKPVFGLPKVANRKLTLAKAEKAEAPAEGAAAAPGAAPAAGGSAPAAGAKAAAAAPAAKGAAPAAAKAAAPAAGAKKK